MSQYQMIVFDWDGTLMDSTSHIVFCMREAIHKLQLSPLTDTAIQQIIGLGLSEAVRTLYPLSTDDDIQRLAMAYREIWLDHPYDSPMFENAIELLHKLAKQNIFLGVATGKGRRGLDKVLEATGLADLFTATRCADECHSKPNPQMLEELMDFCGVKAEDTIMIGDTEFDLLMAHNAKAKSVAITHGAHALDRLEACKPLHIVNDLYALDDWLHGNNVRF